MADHTPGPWHVEEAECSDGGMGWTEWAVTSAAGPICAEVFTEANVRLLVAALEMADELLWIRENLHPRALGRGATDAELVAITRATMVLRKAGVIPDPMAEGRQP